MILIVLRAETGFLVKGLSEAKLYHQKPGFSSQAMNEPSYPIAAQLLDDFKQESQLMDLIMRGCIELRWAIADEEKDLAKTMIYNAFETYLIERGLSIPEVENFVNSIWTP